MKGAKVVMVTVISWLILAVSSEDVECPDPGMPEGGTRRGPSRFSLGSKVSFGCPDGYSRVGSPVSVCKENGEWSLPVPQCIPDCPDIEAPANGAVSVSAVARRKYGSVARFECNPGYSLVGAAAVTCKDGRWNRPVPSCFADCIAVESLPNAVTSGSTSHGDVMSFKCLQGYQLIGQSMITCKDGTWSGDYPSCVMDVMS